MKEMENLLNGMIKKKITESEFLAIVDKQKINKKRCEVFHAFINNLIKTLYSTYLGKEYIKKEEDIKGHYDWCFKKVGYDFLEINFNFLNNVDVYEHFFEYFSMVLYDEGKINLESTVIKFYEKIFSFTGERIGLQLNELQELYIKFNKSLINKNAKTDNL